MSDDTKTFTLQEVANHCMADDCWVIIHGSVYDIFQYLEQHPGGANIVMKSAGTYPPLPTFLVKRYFEVHSSRTEPLEKLFD